MASASELQSPVWLTATLKSLFNRYHQIAVAHSTNNGLLVAQDRKANEIQDPAKRAQVKARIQADVRRQALIASAMRALYGTLLKGRDTLAGALRLIGVNPSPVTGLSDVGVVPVVAIGIGIGLVTAIGVSVAIWGATQVQRQAIANNTDIIDRVLNGQLPLEAGLKLMEANNRQADNSKDLLGLKGAIQAALPVVFLVVAAMLVPPLLRTFGGRRGAAA
jgi:hypothetical protein